MTQDDKGGGPSRRRRIRIVRRNDREAAASQAPVDRPVVDQPPTDEPLATLGPSAEPPRESPTDGGTEWTSESSEPVTETWQRTANEVDLPTDPVEEAEEPSAETWVDRAAEHTAVPTEAPDASAPDVQEREDESDWLDEDRDWDDDSAVGTPPPEGCFDFETASPAEADVFLRRFALLEKILDAEPDAD